MNFLKSLWNWFNGKKRNLSILYWSIITPYFAFIYPNGIPADINKIYILIGLILGATGFGHSVVKNYVENKNSLQDTPKNEN